MLHNVTLYVHCVSRYPLYEIEANGPVLSRITLGKEYLIPIVWMARWAPEQV
jgi:hypothetical protein